MNIIHNKLANEIGISARRINEIMIGKRAINAYTAFRLAKAFGNSVQFWMELQDDYEVHEARLSIKEQLELLMPILA